jgi:hypothetical protein
MRWFFLMALPFVVGFAFGLRVFYNGISVLNTDCVIKPSDCFCTAPEVAELLSLIQRSGVPDNMVMNMRDPYEQEMNTVKLRMENPKPAYDVVVRGRKMQILGEGEWLSFTLEPGEAVFIIDEK